MKCYLKMNSVTANAMNAVNTANETGNGNAILISFWEVSLDWERWPKTKYCPLNESYITDLGGALLNLEGLPCLRGLIQNEGNGSKRRWSSDLLSVRMVPGIGHFENLTLWIQLRFGLCNRAWKDTFGHSRNLAQLSMTIFSKFWSQDRYPICIHGSRSHYFICIVEQVTSEDVVFSERAALGLSFREHKCWNGQICPFSFEDNVLLNRGSKSRYF